MAIPDWGDMPHFSRLKWAQTLKNSGFDSMLKKFSQAGSLPDNMPSYWHDGEPEVEDALYICAEGDICQACSRRFAHSSPDLRRGCRYYRPVPLDGMIGEAYHHEEAHPKKIQFRRYWKETSKTAGQNPLSKADGVAQGQDEV